MADKNKDQNLDPSNLRQMLCDYPEQFKAGFELAKDIKLEGNFKNMVISGIGGSALPGNLLRTYLNDLYKRKNLHHFQIFQNRFYTLPPESYDQSINIICSYSGNTEETIASFNEALKNNLSCVGVSSGGEIESVSKKNNVPYVKLPVPYPDFQPRVGSGYFFSVMLQVLINQGIAPDERSSIDQSVTQLTNSLSEIESLSKDVAKKLVGKTPVIYSSTQYKAIAMINKIKINENAKTPAFWNYLPELDHNEMLGFTLPQAKFFILMYRDPSDHPRNVLRFEATSKLLKEKGLEVEIIDMKGENVFYKMFWSLMLGDFISYYLALEYHQNPTPIVMVEDLKKILAKE
jgi:glucose/mannose-6-phosphate isomerase